MYFVYVYSVCTVTNLFYLRTVYCIVLTLHLLFNVCTVFTFLHLLFNVCTMLIDFILFACNLLHTPRLSHLLRTEVAVSASSIPSSRDGFRMQRGDNSEIFRHSMQQVARYPQVISHLYTFTGSDLEFPLESK